MTAFVSILVISLGIIFTSVQPLQAAPRFDKGVLAGDHGDRSIMPKSCRACHQGMLMKITGEESACLTCHGGSAARAQMVADGFLKASKHEDLQDIEADLRKPYNHPVSTVGGVHRQMETLPEEVTSAYRHSECVDCHDPHLAEKGKPFRGLAGKRVGNFLVEIEHEYELCYKCHSDSANLPGTSTNKYAEFRTSNPSFHPVADEGRNSYVISLREPYVARKTQPGDVSRISCSDCHGSDDPNGPKGPHGSNYRGLLRLNYEMEDGRPESEYAYELCYKCHNRSSILNNESFPFHALHIIGNGAGTQAGTSCFTCHDAHGSTKYPHLLRFNLDVVQPNSAGQLEFKAQGVATRHGSCLLNCHGVEHSPKEY